MNKKNESPEELNERIKADLGVDLSQYRNEDVAEKLVELLVFPLYALSWVIRPVIVAFIMYIVGFFILDLVHIQYLLYGVIGLVLLLVCGVLFGILYFLNRLHKDVETIMNYTLDIASQSMSDLKKVQTNVKSQVTTTDSMRLLVSGVVKIVTVPVLSKVLGNKIPLLGGFLAGSIEKILLMIASKFDFDSSVELSEADVKGDKIVEEKNYDRTFDGSSDRITGILDTVMNVVSVPFRVVFFVIMMVTLFFIYALN